MSKKYLLYIHHPNFALEGKKSELVNSLLDKHYSAFLDVYEALKAAPVPTEDRQVLLPDGSVEPHDYQQFLKDYSDPSQKKPPHPKYGYPCCHNEAKCKHWQYIQNIAQWVNQLTGVAEDAPDF